MAKDPIRLLLEALRIYSPSTKESRFARFLIKNMETFGYSNVHLDKAGNAIGEIGRGSIKVLFCGHMDTVPGDLPVRKTRDSIYGRGAADAKSPLCALLLAGALAADSGVRITFAGVTQEEGDGAGIESLIRSRARFDYAIFGEPSGANRITIGYRGRVALHATVRTEGGHAGSPWAHKSAYDEFSLMLSRLKEYEHSKAIPGDHFRSISISPTVVHAGTFHNVIPGECEATLDLRIPPSMKSSQAVEEVRSVALAHADGARIEIHAGDPTEAYEVPQGSTIVRAFQRAILIKLGAKPTLVRKTGTGDMNTFAQRRRAESITYGPGRTGTSHTDAEFVEIKDYLDSIEVLREALAQLGNLGKGGTS